MQKFCIKLNNLYLDLTISQTIDCSSIAPHPHPLNHHEIAELLEELEELRNEDYEEPRPHHCISNFFKQIRSVWFKIHGHDTEVIEGYGSIISVSPFMLFTGENIICITPNLLERNAFLWKAPICEICFKDIILGKSIFPLIPVYVDIMAGHYADFAPKPKPLPHYQKGLKKLLSGEHLLLFLTCCVLGLLLSLLLLRLSED